MGPDNLDLDQAIETHRHWLGISKGRKKAKVTSKPSQPPKVASPNPRSIEGFLALLPPQHNRWKVMNEDGYHYNTYQTEEEALNRMLLIKKGNDFMFRQCSTVYVEGYEYNS